MKTMMLMSALLLAGSAYVQPSFAGITSKSMEISILEEKVQIKSDELPEPVKNAIAADETLKGAAVAEAWKITKDDGAVHFTIIFTNAQGEKMNKSYDAEGNEIKE